MAEHAQSFAAIVGGGAAGLLLAILLRLPGYDPAWLVYVGAGVGVSVLSIWKWWRG